MARITRSDLPETHVSGVSDQHVLHIAGACAIGVGVAGGTTLMGAVSPVILGVVAGGTGAYAYYAHARRMDGLTPEQIEERESHLASARRVGSDA